MPQKANSRRILALIGAAILTVAGTFSATSAEKRFTRSMATRVVAEARKIVTPGGIERLEKVRIGGIDQWVSIRGRDRSIVHFQHRMNRSAFVLIGPVR